MADRIAPELWLKMIVSVSGIALALKMAAPSEPGFAKKRPTRFNSGAYGGSLCNSNS
jgi:hypothetical protein